MQYTATYGKLNALERSKLVPLHLKMQGFITFGLHCAASVLYTSSQPTNRPESTMFTFAMNEPRPSIATCTCFCHRANEPHPLSVYPRTGFNYVV